MKLEPQQMLWIALGGAAGSVLRAWLSAALTHSGQLLPWSTLAVNVTGSLAIGLLFAFEMHARSFLHPGAKDLLAIGFCGGFTTFSTFSLQTLMLLREERAGAAFANMAANLAFCLLAVWAGLILGRALLGFDNGR
jgi:CrcB protein